MSTPVLLKDSKIIANGDFVAQVDITVTSETYETKAPSSDPIIHVNFDGKAEDNFAAYLRELDGQRICVVCNFDETNKIEIPEAHGEILLSNYGRAQGDERAFRPYEIAVYRLQ